MSKVESNNSAFVIICRTLTPNENLNFNLQQLVNIDNISLRKIYSHNPFRKNTEEEIKMNNCRLKRRWDLKQISALGVV